MKLSTHGTIALAALTPVVLPHAVTAQGQTQTEPTMRHDMPMMHGDMHARDEKALRRGAEMKKRGEEMTKSCYDFAWESQDMKDCLSRQRGGHGHNPSGANNPS